MCVLAFYGKPHVSCNAEIGNIPTYVNSLWHFGVSAVQSVHIQCSLRVPDGSHSVRS